MGATARFRTAFNPGKEDKNHMPDGAERMRRILIRGETVVSVDATVGDFRVGDVLIEGSKIVAVGADLSGEHADEVLDAARMIVLPGPLDTHRHLWPTGTPG